MGLAPVIITLPDLFARPPAQPQLVGPIAEEAHQWQIEQLPAPPKRRMLPGLNIGSHARQPGSVFAAKVQACEQSRFVWHVIDGIRWQAVNVLQTELRIGESCEPAYFGTAQRAGAIVVKNFSLIHALHYALAVGTDQRI